MNELLTHWPSLAAVIGLGLTAGVLGGLLGVGGSVIMIPGLTLLIGPDQHVYQAAAMIVNVAVSVPATWRHYQARAIVPAALRWIVPTALACIFLGVWLSALPIFASGADAGRSDGEQWLRRIFAAFLVYVIVVNIRRLRQPRMSSQPKHWRLAPARGLSVGAIMGTIAGLLGIGGGAIAVPMQQVMMKMPLRNCIANSAAVICITAGFGAIYKNLTLSADGQAASLILAAAMAPTAVVGGWLGGSLTHRLPGRQVRIAFILLMIVAACRMADLWA